MEKKIIFKQLIWKVKTIKKKIIKLINKKFKIKTLYYISCKLFYLINQIAIKALDFSLDIYI
jgi:hypothetical protein